jgi:hypothetical protein
VPDKTGATLWILVVSFLAAVATVPPNPACWYVTAIAIFVVSLVCYRVGRQEKQVVTQTPSDLNGVDAAGRFQFDLRTLVVIVALAAFVFAGIAWWQQLEKRAMFGHQISALMETDLSNYLPDARIVSSGGSGGGSDRHAVTNFSWEYEPGSKIPHDFLDTMDRKIAARLRELGADVCGTGGDRRGGSGSDGSVPASESRALEYRVGDICGTVIVRIVSWGGPNRGAIVFLDHLQAH